MSSTRLVREIDAPRSRVYHALLDRGSGQAWMVPDGMTITYTLTDVDGGTVLVRLVQDEG